MSTVTSPTPATGRPQPAGEVPRAASLLDALIAEADRALRTVTGHYSTSGRESPAGALPETVTNPSDRRQIAGLMRVNHAGEIAAQALYHGQAFMARENTTRSALLQAAREEGDHLAWCAERISELGGRTSLLDPVWYAGSFAIGALAASLGDRTSLGFVAETERQVVAHLQSHLDQLPDRDERTRSVIRQMQSDEARHGGEALRAGGAELPLPVRTIMKLTARIMTTSARWV